MRRPETFDLDSYVFDPKAEVLLAEAILDLRTRGTIDRRYVEAFTESLLGEIEIRCCRYWGIVADVHFYDRSQFTEALCDALGVP